MPFTYLSRTLSISASHRLHSHLLSDKENALIYGVCNRTHGHGHNYKIRLTVAGPVDLTTGMVINIAVLKEIAATAITAPLDHRHLDLDVPYFATRPSTTENLAIYVWEQVSAALESRGLPTKLLHEVKIHETDANAVLYRGE